MNEQRGRFIVVRFHPYVCLAPDSFAKRLIATPTQFHRVVEENNEQAENDKTRRERMKAIGRMRNPRTAFEKNR